MLSGGRPAEALRGWEPQWREMRGQLVDQLTRTPAPDWADQARQWGEYYSELPGVLSWLLTWYRDILLLTLGAGSDLIMNVDQMPGLQATASRTTPGEALDKCRAIVAAADQIDRNLNVQLSLEVMSLQLNQKEASSK
jgi:hypothetical protein